MTFMDSKDFPEAHKEEAEGIITPEKGIEIMEDETEFRKMIKSN